MIRFVFLFAIVSIMMSCRTEAKFEKPEWLIGKWKRIDTEDTTRTTYEVWENDFSGVCYTLIGKDTVFKETMRLLGTREKKFMQIEGMNGQPTFFEIIEEDRNHFVCVNPENEFPKKIAYTIKNKQLNAVVANEDLAVDFVFEKVN